jgi:hypothetical protein
VQEYPFDETITYQDLEPLIEAEVNDPLPDGLVDQQWLELPELDRDWLELPELDQQWLELPELDRDWLPTIEQEQPELSLDTFKLEQGLDLEH